MKMAIFLTSLGSALFIWGAETWPPDRGAQFETACLAEGGRFDPGGWILTRDGLRRFDNACEMRAGIPTIAEIAAAIR